MTSTSPRFIKKAHAAIICGATDCGKTEFTLNLLETEYKQFFASGLTRPDAYIYLELAMITAVEM